MASDWLYIMFLFAWYLWISTFVDRKATHWRHWRSIYLRKMDHLSCRSGSLSINSADIATHLRNSAYRWFGRSVFGSYNTNKSLARFLSSEIWGHMGHWPLALRLDLPFGQSQVKLDSVHNQISPGFPRLSPWTPKVRTASATRTAAFRLANGPECSDG